MCDPPWVCCCLYAYLPEEVVELNDMTEMRSGKKSDIRLFEGIKYVLPILHPNKKRLALIMCPEEDSASVEWARQKDENWVNKDITSLEFVENIFKLMNWNRECRYKVLGRVANSCSWESDLYLCFAEERSEVYCNHAVCCGASHVL